MPSSLVILLPFFHTRVCRVKKKFHVSHLSLLLPEQALEYKTAAHYSNQTLNQKTALNQVAGLWWSETAKIELGSQSAGHHQVQGSLCTSLGARMGWGQTRNGDMDGKDSVEPMARQGRTVGPADWPCCRITRAGIVSLGAAIGFWALGREGGTLERGSGPPKPTSVCQSGHWHTWLQTVVLCSDFDFAFQNTVIIILW